VKVNRLKDVFWVFWLSYCASINLIDKEKKADERHVENKQKYDSDSMIVVNNNGGQSKWAK
jgi:hypothetical protein